MIDMTAAMGNRLAYGHYLGARLWPPGSGVVLWAWAAALLVRAPPGKWAVEASGPTSVPATR